MAYQPLWVNAKFILLKDQQYYYLTHSWGDKWVHAFPKGISLNVNVIVQLEFEVAYFATVVQHVSHYAMETSL